MNYSNDEDLLMNNQLNPKINTKYIKGITYSQNNNINKGKKIIKKQKIKIENINPEKIEYNFNEDIYLNLPRPVQNLEQYQKKENIKKNQIFENMEVNEDNLIPKRSIKSGNAFKINKKITNKKYINKNKINDLENLDNINDILYKNYSNNNISKNNFNILGQNSGKTNAKKNNNSNSNSNFNSNNNISDLKMTKSSIQISGKNFQKKNSYNKIQNNYEQNLYPMPIKSDKMINMNYKNKTKKEYNLKSENIMKELKTNKIKNNKNEDPMELDLDKYDEINLNFVNPNNEYNNIFFYDSKNKYNNNITDLKEPLDKFRVNNNNNIIKKNSAKEKVNNKYIYKKIKNLNKKEEVKKPKNLINIRKKEIKNNIKNNYSTIDLVIKLPFKEEKISLNIYDDNNIKKTIENLINNNNLNESYFEPLLSLVNNSINILKNANNLKITKIKKYNKTNTEELKDDLNYSFILDLVSKNKFNELLEKINSDTEEISEYKKVLNMSI